MLRSIEFKGWLAQLPHKIQSSDKYNFGYIYIEWPAKHYQSVRNRFWWRLVYTLIVRTYGVCKNRLTFDEKELDREDTYPVSFNGPSEKLILYKLAASIPKLLHISDKGEGLLRVQSSSSSLHLDTIRQKAYQPKKRKEKENIISIQWTHLSISMTLKEILGNTRAIRNADFLTECRTFLTLEHRCNNNTSI